MCAKKEGQGDVWLPPESVEGSDAREERREKRDRESGEKRRKRHGLVLALNGFGMATVRGKTEYRYDIPRHGLQRG